MISSYADGIRFPNCVKGMKLWYTVNYLYIDQEIFFSYFSLFV